MTRPLPIPQSPSKLRLKFYIATRYIHSTKIHEHFSSCQMRRTFRSCAFLSPTQGSSHRSNGAPFHLFLSNFVFSGCGPSLGSMKLVRFFHSYCKPNLRIMTFLSTVFTGIRQTNMLQNGNYLPPIFINHL